jgi:hypothetical protein
VVPHPSGSFGSAPYCNNMDIDIHCGVMNCVTFDEHALIEFIEANRNNTERIGYDLGNLQLRIYEINGNQCIFSYKYYGHLSCPTFFKVDIGDQGITVSKSSDYLEEIELQKLTFHPSLQKDVQSVLTKFFPLPPDIKEPCEL